MNVTAPSQAASCSLERLPTRPTSPTPAQTTSSVTPLPTGLSVPTKRSSTVCFHDDAPAATRPSSATAAAITRRTTPTIGRPHATSGRQRCDSDDISCSLSHVPHPP